jgi:dienelactone hydrolase
MRFWDRFYTLVDPEVDAEFHRQIKAGEPAAWAPAAASAVADRDAQRAAEIPVEKIGGPVLLISGRRDAMWPSELLANIAVERLRQHDFGYRFEHLCYPDAGHMIGVPYRPTSVTDAKHPLVPIVMALGGTPAGNAHASEDSWSKVLTFLDSALAYHDREKR